MSCATCAALGALAGVLWAVMVVVILMFFHGAKGADEDGTEGGYQPLPSHRGQPPGDE